MMDDNEVVSKAAISALKDNLEGLYLIESDLPFMSEGVAKVVKIACENLGREWR